MRTETSFTPPIEPFPPTPRSRGRRRFSGGRRRRRFSPYILISGLLTLLVVASAGFYFIIMPRLASHAAGADAQPNMNCTLIVPANPLTAKGLATPYKLEATNPADGPCNEANTAQSAFVQSVIYNPSTGAFSVYNPLIIDNGTQPAIAPTVPTLPRRAVVGIWFGFNATNLLLQGSQRNTLAQARCVNGLGQSLFTQFAYCNAISFFSSVNQGIASHVVTVPALQTAKDGLPCPTVRDFSLIDQDQSDNVQTQYLSLPNGQIAQFSAANQANLQNATVLDNPSDNALLTNFVGPTLGCQEWEAPNLADAGAPVATLALDELQAASDQQAPVAVVPLNDPMTTITYGTTTRASLAKTNLYRLGVDQIPAYNTQQASGTTYCQNFLQTGMPRLVQDEPLTTAAATPDPGAANNLFTFLAQRFQASYDNLNCPQLLNIPNPVTTQTDQNGVVISATFASQSSASAPSCSVNGQTLTGCSGTTTINGVACTVAFNQTANQVQFTCPAK
jgi:hypothetical protein